MSLQICIAYVKLDRPIGTTYMIKIQDKLSEAYIIAQVQRKQITDAVTFWESL